MHRPLRLGFRLRPAAEVPAWGGELHWFGLSDGAWWLDAGGAALFRYADGEPVTYYLARLHEDLLGMLPDVLAPVPPAAAAQVATPAAAAAWLEACEARFPGDGGWDARLAETGWWGDRRLDLGYLADAPDLRLWRVGETLHWRWAAPAAWAVRAAEGTAPIAAFMAMLAAFHADLMAAMARRLDAPPAPGVALDPAAYAAEQAWREAAWARALGKPGGRRP